MKKNITSRLELLLAKIAGRDVDLSTMMPPVAMNLQEELLLDIADRMDSASSELPSVTKSDEGKLLSVNNKGKWVAASAPSGLPEVTQDDEGFVLTVVDGSWSADMPYPWSAIKVAHIQLSNKTAATVSAHGTHTIADWDMVDLDAETPGTIMEEVPEYDFAIVNSVFSDMYDSNGSDIHLGAVVQSYTLTSPAPEGYSDPFLFAISIYNATDSAKAAGAGCITGAEISLYKIGYAHYPPEETMA